RLDALLVGRRHRPHAGVLQREVHESRERAVRAGRIVLAALRARADQLLLPRRREDGLRVHGRRARLDVDVRDHVLLDRLAGPQELAGLAVERVDEPRLARDAGDDLAPLTRPHARADPPHRVGIRRDLRLDQQALERVIEIPMVDDVLEVPDDLAGIPIERERRVVVEVLLVGPPEHELRRRGRHRRADVDAVQLGVEARHHPHADVQALLVRYAAPGLVAGLAGLWDRARAPELLAGQRVERGDHAGLRSALGLAAAPRDDLAVDDDRARAVLRAG